MISRFMKGVFNEKPSLPRYTRTWDVRVVLQYLKTMDITSLIALSCKLAMLFLLVKAQRYQIFHIIKLGDINHLPDGIVINISQLIKQSRPGVHLALIVLNAYKTDESLCIVRHYDGQYFFNSLSRGYNGLSCPDGNSCFISNHFCFIHDLAKSVLLEQSCIFEAAPCKPVFNTDFCSDNTSIKLIIMIKYSLFISMKSCLCRDIPIFSLYIKEIVIKSQNINILT